MEQMREEDFTPAELRKQKVWVAECVKIAYAKEVKSRADMTAAELREELEMRDKLVTCLRAEVNAQIAYSNSVVNAQIA